MSSSAGTQSENTRVLGGRLSAVLANDERIAIMKHLAAAGDVDRSELEAVTMESLAAGTPTDHDRVRAAVSLQVDHLPALVEAELVTVSDDRIALAFLPGETIRELQEL